MRERLAAAIVTAYRDGQRVGEIARVSGYGREQVRRILRANGVEPEGTRES
ncbi:helix-turn-helix domain-containing protein [Micromonospora schwarzwaldensis]|uniref:helix-turn-helix domain-containing protein n=1 Tax=Micromonospora sp. DSM 45708 TaxID=3111767 RepID=UPI0031D15953